MADEVEVTDVSDRQMQQRKYGPDAADRPYGITFSSEESTLKPVGVVQTRSTIDTAGFQSNGLRTALFDIAVNTSKPGTTARSQITGPMP